MFRTSKAAISFLLFVMIAFDRSATASSFDSFFRYDPKSYDYVVGIGKHQVNINLLRKQIWIDGLPLVVDRDEEITDGRLSNVDFGSYATIPLLPAFQSVGERQTLIFSDSPETFREFGLLYRDVAEGSIRLYGTHVNGTLGDARVASVLTNPSNDDVTVKVFAEGVPKTSTNYPWQGSKALLDWFFHEPEEERTLLLHPGETTTLYDSGKLRTDDGVHFLFGLESDGPVEVSFAAIEAQASIEGLSKLPPLQRDVHDRGTFRLQDFSKEMDISDGKPIRVRIGAFDSFDEHWLRGTDSLTGERAQLFGNYGAFYDLAVGNPGKAKFYIVPVRGYYKGTVLFNGEAVETEGVELGQAYLIGETDGKDDVANFRFGAPSGSYMPFELLITPVQGER